MRYDEDIEIDPSFREERERAEAKAERERMIREQVVRVMSGAAAEDLAEDERLRLEQEAAEQARWQAEFNAKYGGSSKKGSSGSKKKQQPIVSTGLLVGNGVRA